MVETILNTREARKKFYQLLKEINEEHKEVQIIDEATGNNAVLISLEYWQSIKETLLLEQTGVLKKVKKIIVDLQTSMKSIGIKFDQSS